MEATTARIVGHEFDHAPPQTAGPTETGDRILEVLRKAQVREDRHMSRERIAQELGAFRGGCAAIYRSLEGMVKAGAVTERLDIDFGETTFHLPRPEVAPTTPVERMPLSANEQTPDCGVKCPHCMDEFSTAQGCNIHIGRRHKGGALLELYCISAPKPPKPAQPKDDEDEDDEELPEVLEGAGVTSIAALHRKLMMDAGKHGWTIEVLQASKPQGEGTIRFSYTHAASKVAS